MDKYILWIHRLKLAQLITEFDKVMKKHPITIVHSSKLHGLNTVEVNIEATGSESELKTFADWMKHYSAYRT